MTSPLFAPIQLGHLTLDNRIVIPPMCQYSARDGEVGDWHLMHLGNLSHSGAGLLIAEATAVVPEGRISPACPGLWNEATEAAWARVIRAIRTYSSMPLAVQLAHAGRKASTHRPWEGRGRVAPEDGGWQTVAPSPLAFDPTYPQPRELGREELAALPGHFAQAAQRAARAGFDAIEIHAAHGYLLHQFLSPLSNQRRDDYGGSLENRMRLTLEVFTAVRAAFPAQGPVGIRLSATDWVAGGWDLEQTEVLTRELAARGCDFFHISTGGLSPLQQIHPEPGYQLPFARRIKAATGVPTIGVGLITEARQAEGVIQAQDADLVAIGRAMLYNPRWPWHAAAELGAQISAPPQYWRSNPAHLRPFRQD